MNVISWLLTACLVLSVPVCFILWVWTHDVRWLGTGVIVAAAFGLVTIMGKNQ